MPVYWCPPRVCTLELLPGKYLPTKLFVPTAIPKGLRDSEASPRWSHKRVWHCPTSERLWEIVGPAGPFKVSSWFQAHTWRSFSCLWVRGWILANSNFSTTLSWYNNLYQGAATLEHSSGAKLILIGQVIFGSRINHLFISFDVRTVFLYLQSLATKCEAPLKDNQLLIVRISWIRTGCQHCPAQHHPALPHHARMLVSSFSDLPPHPSDLVCATLVYSILKVFFICFVYCFDFEVFGLRYQFCWFALECRFLTVQLGLVAFATFGLLIC